VGVFLTLSIIHAIFGTYLWFSLFIVHQHSYYSGSFSFYLKKIFFASLNLATFPLPFIVVLGGGKLRHLQRFLQYIKYIIPEFTPSTSLLHPPSPDSWNSFNRYHFCIYIHVYTFAPYPNSATYGQGRHYHHLGHQEWRQALHGRLFRVHLMLSPGGQMR
jgi:hypothetical protein